MDAKSNAHVQWCNELQHHGWDVDFADSIRSNFGSETPTHLHAKTASFRYLKSRGYRVKTELSHADRGTVDVCAIPQKTEEHPVVVELETNPTEDVIQDKRRRYVEGTPFRDVLVVDLGKLPMDINKMETQIAEAIGL